jgi:hypothetical protein
MDAPFIFLSFARVTLGILMTNLPASSTPGLVTALVV